jgi:hypothetical protein
MEKTPLKKRIRFSIPESPLRYPSWVLRKSKS